jgi:mannose-6-phosphate isomerase-like protein (cupin superfamily)
MKVDKPWGYELIWAKTDKYVGKILHIEEGHKLSLQYHEVKDETIYVIAGEMDLVIVEDGKERIEKLTPGDYRHLPTGTVHRMISVKSCDIFEVSTPELDDVVRLEDVYGRAGGE